MPPVPPGAGWVEAAVDGRPLQRDGDAVVLAPFQHLWSAE